MMLKSVFLLCLAVAVVAGEPTPNKQTKDCYKCVFAPPKEYQDTLSVFEKEKIYKTDEFGNRRPTIDYKEIKLPVTCSQGDDYDTCKNEISFYDAIEKGIGTQECDKNCYVRKDYDGNIFRGCYSGQMGIDQNKLGCHKQMGETWCFCYGDRCNSGEDVNNK